MARPIVTPEQFADMPFPVDGLDLLLGYGMQRVGTTPVGNNVRTYEPLTGRGRGGSRPGLVEYVPAVIPANPAKSLLIQHLNVIVDPDAIAQLNNLGNGNGSGIPPTNLGPTAVLDTSSPDEIGARTNGDYWVPQGGWGVVPIRHASNPPKVLFGYMILMDLVVSATYSAGGNQGEITVTGNMTCNLNGNTVGSLNGTSQWPADINGTPNDYYADINNNTDSRVPPQINNPPPTNLMGPHHSTASMSIGSFVFGNPPGTGINTLSITGTYTVSAPNPAILVPGFTWVQAFASARRFRSNDNGSTWTPALGTILAPVSGFVRTLGQSSGPLESTSTSSNTLSITFGL